MLTLQQKSAYLIILHATMILRSMGRIEGFKKSLFKKIDHLTCLMDNGSLTEAQIIRAIRSLARKFDISIGQSQKAINVILKYHFYLSTERNEDMRNVLHCPIDKITLEALHWEKLPLNSIDLREYGKIQRKIATLREARIDFDEGWDRQMLERNGTLAE